MKSTLLILLAGATLLSCAKKDEAAPAPSITGTWTSVSEQYVNVDAAGVRTESTSTFGPQQFRQEFSLTTLKAYHDGTLDFEQPYRVSHDTLYVGNPVVIAAAIKSLTASRLELLSTHRANGITTTITSVSTR
jgi:hypothetical protein